MSATALLSTTSLASSEPSVDSLEVTVDKEDRVVLDYEVSDPDGDLDEVSFFIAQCTSMLYCPIVDHGEEDVSGSDASGVLKSDPLESGDYEWGFQVRDKDDNKVNKSGSVTV